MGYLFYNLAQPAKVGPFCWAYTERLQSEGKAKSERSHGKVMRIFDFSTLILRDNRGDETELRRNYVGITTELRRMTAICWWLTISFNSFLLFCGRKK